MTAPLRHALPFGAAARQQPKAAGHGRWALAGVVLGSLVTLVLWAPARWLAAAVEQASQSQVRLANPRGTLWDGSAQLALSGGSGSSDTVALPGFVEWRIRPAWGGLQVALNARCCTAQPLQLQAQALGLHALRLTLQDNLSVWPSSLLVGLGTPWNTLQLQGKLALSTQSLALELGRNSMAVSGQLQLDATQVSSRLSTLKPMGSYRVTVVGGAAPTVQLQTLEGSLQLTGSGRWVGSRLSFEGEATAQPDRIEALSNLLNIIGRRSGARSIIKVGTT